MFEHLESRTLFDGAIIAQTVLTINGTAANDTVLLSQSNGSLTVTKNGVTTQHATSGTTNGVPWTISKVAINGLGGNDKIQADASVTKPLEVFAGNGNDTVTGGGGRDSVHGGIGKDLLFGATNDDVIWGDSDDDSLYGMDGRDRLYPGAGTDVSLGGPDNDVIVSVGGGQADSNWGEGGVDELWVDSESAEHSDADSTEVNERHVHRVSSFLTLKKQLLFGTEEQPVSRELNGQALIDPLAMHNNLAVVNFSDNPLFASGGPSASDIFQGAVGDCYFMSFLGSIADTHPERIRPMVVELGDGTYGVHFYEKQGSEFLDRFVRVDADLYTDASNGTLKYADEGQESSIWVAIVEKAWAFFRYGQGTYASIESGDGHVQDAFAMNGILKEVGLDPGVTSAADLGNYLQAELNADKPVLLGGPGSFNGPWRGARSSAHVYMVEEVYTNGSGTFLRLRNPYNGDVQFDISIEWIFARCRHVFSYTFATPGTN